MVGRLALAGSVSSVTRVKVRRRWVERRRRKVREVRRVSLQLRRETACSRVEWVRDDDDG